MDSSPLKTNTEIFVPGKAISTIFQFVKNFPNYSHLLHILPVFLPQSELKLLTSQFRSLTHTSSSAASIVNVSRGNWTL